MLCVFRTNNDNELKSVDSGSGFHTIITKYIAKTGRGWAQEKGPYHGVKGGPEKALLVVNL